MKEANLSVNPTRGEGFGLIPLEHMATGLPTIVSSNTGCQEYINPKFNIGLDCKQEPSFFNRIGGDFGYDMVPTIKSIKEKILWCYENREEAKEMGKRASEWVKTNLTWDHSALKMMNVIEHILGSGIYFEDINQRKEINNLGGICQTS